MDNNAPTILDLINAKRASGFDGEFEALLQPHFYCPHCRCSKTILQTAIPQLERASEPIACADCDKTGIRHLRGQYEHTKLFRNLLNKLAPFNRSGTA